MKRTALVLEIIALILGITNNMISQEIFGLSKSDWNVIIFLILIGGFALLFWDSNSSEKHIREMVVKEVTKIQNDLKPKEGTIESVTSEDREHIIYLIRDMKIIHKHSDLTGLIADRASGIPLNELMQRNCSRCGQPRNKKSTIKHF
jgi:hypothetical protein